MGGYNLTNTGYRPYYPQQPAQATATTSGGSLSTFDLNDPMAFLKSMNTKLSAALKPININRNELSPHVDTASLDRLNIKLVDPPPVYNQYPIQGYSYPTQGYGQQMQPQYPPQYANYGGQPFQQMVAPQYPPQYVNYGGQPFQQMVAPQYPPQYANYGGQPFQQTVPPPQYMNYGGQSYPPQYQQPYQAQYGSSGYYGGQQPYQPQYQQPSQPAYGYTEANFPPQTYQEPPQGLPFPPTSPFNVGNNTWLSEEVTNNPHSSTINTADITAIKQQLANLKTTKTTLRKRLDNDKLSTTEKEALNSQLDDLKQEERKLRAELRRKNGRQGVFNKGVVGSQQMMGGFQNPIVNTTNTTTTTP